MHGYVCVAGYGANTGTELNLDKERHRRYTCSNIWALHNGTRA